MYKVWTLDYLLPVVMYWAYYIIHQSKPLATSVTYYDMHFGPTGPSAVSMHKDYKKNLPILTLKLFSHN